MQIGVLASTLPAEALPPEVLEIMRMIMNNSVSCVAVCNLPARFGFTRPPGLPVSALNERKRGPESVSLQVRFILVKKDERLLEGIEQFYVSVEEEEGKLDTLCDLYASLDLTQATVFVNTRRKVGTSLPHPTSDDQLQPDSSSAV